MLAQHWIRKAWIFTFLTISLASRAAEVGASAKPTVSVSENIVFLGSSSIYRWKTLQSDFADRKVINLGHDGTSYVDLLKQVDEVTPLSPMQIVFYSGDNDLAQDIAGYSKTASDVEADFTKVATLYHEHFPRAKMTVISIKTSPFREKYKEKFEAANAKIKAYTQRNSDYMSFVDMTDALMINGKPNQDLYHADYKLIHLHLNEKGYKIWRDRLEPELLHHPLESKAKATDAKSANPR